MNPASMLPVLLDPELVQQVVDGAAAGGQPVGQLVIRQLVTKVVIVWHTRRGMQPR